MFGMMFWDLNSLSQILDLSINIDLKCKGHLIIYISWCQNKKTAQLLKYVLLFNFQFLFSLIFDIKLMRGTYTETRLDYPWKMQVIKYWKLRIIYVNNHNAN